MAYVQQHPLTEHQLRIRLLWLQAEVEQVTSPLDRLDLIEQIVLIQDKLVVQC